MRISRNLPISIGLFFVFLTGVAEATSTTCATSVVCAEYINSSSGVAIHGEANTGIGIRGTSNGSTGFYGASRSGSTFFPGVEGESLNQTGADIAGGFGLTAESGGAPPAFGVIAYGSVSGVSAEADGPGNGTKSTPTTVGILGFDSGGTSGADTNVAVAGQSTNGTALLGLANATTAFGGTYFGKYSIGVYVDGEATKKGGGIGVETVSSDIPLDAYNPTTGTDVALTTQSYLIDADPFTVDNNGNVTANKLTLSMGTAVRTTGSSGTTRMSYSARTTVPVMEDFGEAQLVNGRGYVKLDPALSDVIDKRNAYYVFITPEGDSNGLYVTQKTPAGFAIREQRAGRSTLAFQYRILAKPVDDNATRLALAPPLPVHERRERHAVRGVSAAPQVLLDPFARLQSHLGPAEYARELKAARKNQSVP